MRILFGDRCEVEETGARLKAGLEKLAASRQAKAARCWARRCKGALQGLLTAVMGFGRFRQFEAIDLSEPNLVLEEPHGLAVRGTGLLLGIVCRGWFTEEGPDWRNVSISEAEGRA